VRRRPNEGDEQQETAELRVTTTLLAHACDGSLEGRAEGDAFGGHPETLLCADGPGQEVFEAQVGVVVVAVDVPRLGRPRHLQEGRQFGVLCRRSHDRTVGACG
jgi:hypothetical protein